VRSWVMHTVKAFNTLELISGRLTLLLQTRTRQSTPTALRLTPDPGLIARPP